MCVKIILMSNYVSHLECSFSKKRYTKDKIHNLSEESKPILVKYDFKKILTDYSYNDFVNRHTDYPGFWKYLPLLPIIHQTQLLTLEN